LGEKRERSVDELLQASAVTSDSVADESASIHPSHKRASKKSRTGTGRSGKAAGKAGKSKSPTGRKWRREPRVGTRRSPRAHSQAEAAVAVAERTSAAGSSDEEETSGPETVVNDDTLEDAQPLRDNLTPVSLIVVVVAVLSSSSSSCNKDRKAPKAQDRQL